MNFVTELKSLLEQETGGAASEKLFSVAKVGFHLQKQFETVEAPAKPLLGIIKRQPKRVKHGLRGELGASRVGGTPDAPPEFTWPRMNGEPMQFLAQINCSEIATFSEETLLPTTGMLYFFFDHKVFESSDSQNGGTNKCVCFQPTESQPVRVPAPSDSNDFTLPSFPVKLLPIPTFPDGMSAEFDSLNLRDEESDGLFEARAKWQKKFLDVKNSEWGGLHQLAGFPSGIQNDVLVEAEMVAEGHRNGTDRQLWQSAEKKSRDWRLLLQFDSDDDVNAMWGDAGKLYFCIRQDDLRAGRFNKTCVVFQCH